MLIHKPICPVHMANFLYDFPCPLNVWLCNSQYNQILTAIKNHVIKYCTTVYERNGKKLFWSIKNSGEILNKLKSRDFLASGLSTYYFSTLYTTLPHNLIKEKLTELIEQTFNREGSLYLACNDKKMPFLPLNNLNDINCGHVKKCVMRYIIFRTIYL